MDKFVVSYFMGTFGNMLVIYALLFAKRAPIILCWHCPYPSINLEVNVGLSTIRMLARYKPSPTNTHTNTNTNTTAIILSILDKWCSFFFPETFKSEMIFVFC